MLYANGSYKTQIGIYTRFMLICLCGFVGIQYILYLVSAQTVNHIKVIDVQQAKLIHSYKNTKLILYISA